MGGVHVAVFGVTLKELGSGVVETFRQNRIRLHAIIAPRDDPGDLMGHLPATTGGDSSEENQAVWGIFL